METPLYLQIRFLSFQLSVILDFSRRTPRANHSALCSPNYNKAGYHAHNTYAGPVQSNGNLGSTRLLIPTVSQCCR
jgi:hypothetical protein